MTSALSFKDSYIGANNLICSMFWEETKNYEKANNFQIDHPLDFVNFTFVEGGSVFTDMLL